MRNTIILIILGFYINSNLYSQSQIRFDGLYQTEKKDDLKGYLRFYPDSTIHSVTSEGEANEITSWFSNTNDSIIHSIGLYEIKKDKIYASTTSKNGTVIYKGKIKSEYKLIFKSKSLINGHKSKDVYYFILLK